MDYTQLKTAIQRFGDMLNAYRNNMNRPPLEQEAVYDSLIKRFEYTRNQLFVLRLKEI